jgi:hypothetical protein
LIEQILSYKTLFFDVVTTIGYALLPAMNQSLHAALVKMCTSRGGPLFHSSYGGVIARKMLPTQSIYHQPEQVEARRRQIRTIRWVWYDSPAKIDNVLHVIQTGIGPGIIVLQEKGCLLLWTDSGNSSLQRSQHRNVAVRVDGLSRRITITPFLSQKTVHITLPAEGSVLNFSSMGNSHVATPWTAV